MAIQTIKPNNEFLGCWCAYVESGKTREERIRRLNEAPDKHRQNIINHVVTVDKLNEK